MRTRAIILAGGEGTRLGVLTAKRTKPAVMFGGKYRIIDFPLSNCVNSNIFDIMIIAQYRPQSLIEHIGAGGPWDLNRDFTGGVRIYTPYKARGSNWFVGTADAVQQNFGFIKRNLPDHLLILSGDHIYTMDYTEMIKFHEEKGADVSLAVITVPINEASRFGIVGIDENNQVTSFIEKPQNPPSNLANMGVYLFNRDVLDKALWEDHLIHNSSHDFGKDILPRLIERGVRIFAYPYSGYWVDVGTIQSYWQSHMDLLGENPPLNLTDRSWIIHTRTEERPPAKIRKGAKIEDSLICDGCIIEPGAKVVRSILSPGVHIHSGAVVQQSIILTDSIISEGSGIFRSILDKRVYVGRNTIIGELKNRKSEFAMIGLNSTIPEEYTIETGAMIGTDVVPDDLPDKIAPSGVFIQTRRLPNEL